MFDRYNWGDKRTNRRREQHRLWQECGTLHRTLANVSGLARKPGILPHEFAALNNAANIIFGMIEQNARDMKTIKERISND